MKEITADMLAKSQRTLIMHLNFGGQGHGYHYRCVQYPRLTMTKRHYKGAAARKAGTEFEQHFFVDGDEVMTLAEAAQKLMAPAVLSADEEAALARFPAEWADFQTANDALDPLEERAAELFDALANKGAIERKFIPEPDPKRAEFMPMKPVWRRTPK